MKCNRCGIEIDEEIFTVEPQGNHTINVYGWGRITEDSTKFTDYQAYYLEKHYDSKKKKWVDKYEFGDKSSHGTVCSKCKEVWHKLVQHYWKK